MLQKKLLNKKISNRYFGILTQVSQLHSELNQLNGEEVKDKIERLYSELKIVEIKEVEGNEKLFTITKGARNQVLRSAYLDSLTNKLLIKGIAEKISDG